MRWLSRPLLARLQEDGIFALVQVSYLREKRDHWGVFFFVTRIILLHAVTGSETFAGAGASNRASPFFPSSFSFPSPPKTDAGDGVSWVHQGGSWKCRSPCHLARVHPPATPGHHVTPPGQELGPDKHVPMWHSVQTAILGNLASSSSHHAASGGGRRM